MQKFTIKVGNVTRTYTITEVREMSPIAAEDFKARGFDGKFYSATSEPTGRQRKTYIGLFLRDTSGRMVSA